MLAHTRRGASRRQFRRRGRLGLGLLIAGGVYLLMAAEGAAAPPAVSMTGAPLSYTENASATAVDTGLTINEPEGDDVLGATVRIITNYQNGADVLAFADQLGITGAWNSGVGILTLSGTATAADYQTALQSVTYHNTSDAPSTLTRTVQVVVTDENAESGNATRDIDVTAVDDPLDVTTTGGSLAFTEGSAATAVDTGMTVTDVDHDVTGATVAITGNYVNGEDVLAFSDQLGITGNWVPGTGVLTLTGTTTTANYQTALRTVTYANASENPSGLPRSVTFSVTSPGNTDAGVRVIAITAVNDAPGAPGPTTVTDPGGGAANVLEDSVPGAANIRLTPPALTDVDSSAPTQVRIMSVTGGTVAQSDGSAIGLGSGGSLLTIAGGNVDLRFTPAANRDTDASFDYVVVDAANPSINSSSSTATVPIVPVNDVPAVTVTGGAAAYTENGPGVAFDSGATVSDVDDTNIESATIQITTNYASGEDLLSFTNQLGITGAWDGGSGTMTLTGPAPVADFQTAIRSVTYSNSSDNPSTATRTLALLVDDGDGTNPVATRGMTVAATNDAPTVSATGGSAAYTENAAPVVLDGGLTTADVDSTNLTGATLQITGNYANGEDTLAFTNQSGIIGSWTASTGTLELSGSATVAQYQAAMRTITYVNTSDAPSTAARTVTIIVNDGSAPSAGATRGIAVTAVNDAPVLAGTGGSITYTENDAAHVIDAGLTIADADHASMSGATVTISAGYWNGEDVLAFTNQSGITSSWDSGAGVMTLSGSATNAQYQTAIRSVTYVNTSDDPSGATRTISFVVTDGTTPSNAVTRDVAVVPVNDLPVASLASGAVSYVEDDPPVALDSTLTVADPDDTTLTGARVTMAGYVLGQDALTATLGSGITGWWDASQGVLTLAGPASPSAYQSVLRTVTYVNASADPSTATRVLSVDLDDPDGTGPAATRSITVTSVNDAPVAANDQATTVQATAVTVDVVDNDSDIEGDSLAVTAATSSSGGSATVASANNVTVTPDTSFVGTLTVTYTLSDGAATDTGTLTVTVTPAADIRLTLTPEETSVRERDDAEFDLVVRNTGPGTAVGTDIVVHTADPYRMVYASTAGGNCDWLGTEVICELPDITANASALVEVRVNAARTGTMSVNATGVSASFDEDTSDNEASASVRVTARSSGSPSVPARPPANTTTTTSGFVIPPPETTTTSSSTSTTVPRTTTTRRSTTTTTVHKTESTVPADDHDDEKQTEGGRSTGVTIGLAIMILGILGAIVVWVLRRRVLQ